MFEQFPYANFHEMNMDWVIKVVKDFLDKYEYIEELINTGKTDIVNLTNEELQALTDKKNELEALLQAWYDSHSADIAQQLAEAISAFNTAADNKAAQTIASIPADYTTLSNNVTDLLSAMDNCEGNIDVIIGNEIDVTITPTINNVSIHGVTATYENGKLKVYGTAEAVRYFLFLNGQNTEKTTSGTFSQTLSAGRYIVHIAASGYLSNTTPALYYTRTTFADAIEVKDEGVIDSAVPVMVGLRFPYNATVGTENNPGYYSVSITPVVNKKGIVLTSNVPTIPDGSDVDSYTTPGTFKVTNNTHAATILNLPAPVAGKLVVLETSQPQRVIQIYFLQSMSGSILRYRIFNGTDWADWQTISTASVLNALKERVDYLEKTINVIYESGPWGDATERVQVYVPATDGYIMYRLYHYIDAADNCNGWQVYHAYHVDDDFSNAQDLTITGEWECAIHLAGRSDFSGGHTHGDEVMTNVVFLLDGAPADITTLTTRVSAKKFQMIQTSNMYDPADHETVIAEHGKELVFSGKMLTINQSLTWLVSENLTNCFLGMFLPSKNWIDRAAANSDFQTILLPSETGTVFETVTKRKATSVDMWDTGSGFSACVGVPIYPTGLTGGDLITISDNNGGDYNKLYFKICGEGTTSSVNELWKSKTTYELNFS